MTQTYTIEEVAEILGCHTNTVRKAAAAGMIPSRLVTERKRIFPRAMLDRWLAGDDPDQADAT